MVRSGRAPNSGASASVELGMCHPLIGMWICLLTWKLSELHSLGFFFMKASSHKPDQLFTQPPTPFPSLEVVISSILKICM